MQCTFCEDEFKRLHSQTRYCSFHCRFLDVAATFRAEAGCWNWPYSTNVQTGYGQFMTRRDGKSKMFTAHRLAYEIFIGPIDGGLCVLHRCDNRKCFNPAHLFLGTQRQNMDDMMRKGRYGGARRRHGGPKLDCEKVRMIRASDEPHAALARIFDVQPSVIRSIRLGRSWKQV